MEQTPAEQRSVPLQKVPSSHAVPVRLVHVPGVTPLQVTQSVATPPPHALVQQTVSTQVVPVWHMASRLQEPPGVFTGWHWFRPPVVLQKNPPVHWLSWVQPPWQAVPLQGVVGPHETGV
jgi:hypothetical protein